MEIEDDEEAARRSLNETLAAGPLKDRMRLALVTTAESEAQKHGMSVSQIVMASLADLTFKFTEQLARDIEMFAQHAGRKSVNIDDIILAARRNEDVASSLKSFSQELLKAKDQQMEKKRKKSSTKGEKSAVD